VETLRFDLAQESLRSVNQRLHGPPESLVGCRVEIHNPDGAHNIAVGLNAPVEVTIHGHAGYYAAGMNQLAHVRIEGSASTGVAENMMSGRGGSESAHEIAGVQNAEGKMCSGP
jgi:hypothetical protein